MSVHSYKYIIPLEIDFNLFYTRASAFDPLFVDVMGANRKLQQEIDRTLKKVAEGIEIFDQIWEKVVPHTLLSGFVYPACPCPTVLQRLTGASHTLSQTDTPCPGSNSLWWSGIEGVGDCRSMMQITIHRKKSMKGT